MINEAKTFNVENMVHSDASDEYKQHALKWTEEQVGRKLFNILWQNKLPAVVDIDEHIDYSYQNQWMGVPNDRIRISVTITPIKYRNIEILSTPLGYANWMGFMKHENVFHKMKRKFLRWRRKW